MVMLSLNFLFLGYRKIIIPPEQLAFFTSALVRASVASKVSPNGEVYVRECDVEKIKKIIAGRNDFELSEPKGLYGKIKETKNKAIIVLALLISVFVVVLLSEIVWDIRVDGNDRINDYEIIKALNESGFQVGSLWNAVDMGKVESNVLSNTDHLSWININRRGNVAYIKVMEKENFDELPAEDKMQYCNIVAEKDCIIEEITVTRGRALVKAGDAVKKGEILVLGIGSDETGGKFCAAEATVIGRVTDSVKAYVDRKIEIKSYDDGKLCNISINLFKISINIFKKYGNLTKECAIIEDEIEYTLPGGKKLPFSFTAKYALSERIILKEYSDGELIDQAAQKLNAMTLDLLSECDLLKIKSYGEFTDDGYYLVNDIVFLAEIGRCVEFKVD